MGDVFVEGQVDVIHGGSSEECVCVDEWVNVSVCVCV